MKSHPADGPPALVCCAFCTGQDKIQLEATGDGLPPTITVDGRHDKRCPLGYSAVASIVLSGSGEVMA